MITPPRERPRPGRRRLSMHHLPLSLYQMFLFMITVLSVLCIPVEATGHPNAQSRAAPGIFWDNRILFDHNPVPLPYLHRRDDSASTDTTSTTTSSRTSSTSSSASSTTLTSLPRAFDGGFGTNYSQPSCPTFLRAMVNNETFNSCVPFSLLLGVRFAPIESQVFPRPLKLPPAN